MKRILGVIDKKLKFDIHINPKVYKVNSTLGVIIRTFAKRYNNTYNYIYKSWVRLYFIRLHIRLHMEYASQVHLVHQQFGVYLQCYYYYIIKYYLSLI